MTIKKLLNFTFPVGHGVLSQDAYYRALSEANGGFYPFGENRIWHGGIHIDNGVLTEIDGGDNSIRCMANGEVVAYRVNAVYPSINYGTKNIIDLKQKQSLHVGQNYTSYFSTGFTLVRHYFVMPKIKGETNPPPSITLYSLYMHQLDWYGYQKIRNNVRHPSYWHLTSANGSSEAKDKIRGTIIRKNGSKTEGVGLLLKGSKIKVGDQKGTTKWYQLTEIVSGGFFDISGQFHQNLDSITGYVYASEVGVNGATTIDSTYTIQKQNNDKLGEIKSEQPVHGIAVYKNANKNIILTYIAKTASFELDGQENGYAKITEIKNVYIPESLIKTNEDGSQSHEGWVDMVNLTDFDHTPKELDNIVVLDKPVPIQDGDFIGYLGHNQSMLESVLPQEHSLTTEKRPSDALLSAYLQGHFELFTGDDLPAFITKTQSLADKLPDQYKSLILLNKGAQLISESPTNSQILSGYRITFPQSEVSSYYIKVNIYYILELNSAKYVSKNVILNKKADGVANQPVLYRLTADNKESLINSYKNIYPELSVENIPDIVELVSSTENTFNNNASSIGGNGQNIDIDSSSNSNHIVKIRFSLADSKSCWVKSEDVIHLQGGDGQLNQSIACWKAFPLTLDNLPAASNSNTVNYLRTIPLSSIEEEYYLAIDDNLCCWAYVTAANELYQPIKGWVQYAQEPGSKAQGNVSLVSPWKWSGFSTVKETAGISDLVNKLRQNRKMTLDLSDYTDSMTALHGILTKTPLNAKEPYSLPAFTNQQLKEGLRTSWVAEQIGRLVINYESEWYADESLSKWNELDGLYQKEKEQKKQTIHDEATEKGSDKLLIKQALDYLDNVYDLYIDKWKIEKEQRIKPSLWWSEVATAQAAQTSRYRGPRLSNLPENGSAWHLHPVGMRSFKTRKCFCHRDFTVKELSSIILSMRTSERILTKTLFDDERAIKMGVTLSKEECLWSNFTEHLNRVFREFEINTCLRKIHFLAQSYVETDRFRSSVEYGITDKVRYYPYHGRGLIHLSNEEAYRRYQPFSGTDCYNTPDVVMNSIEEICNSGAWFWRKGKKFEGNVATMMWTTQKEEGGAYKMETYDYKDPVSLETKSYRAVNFNLIADDDKINLISWLINGGSNGKAERVKACSKLKELFDYENICVNFSGNF